MLRGAVTLSLATLLAAGACNDNTSKKPSEASQPASATAPSLVPIAELTPAEIAPPLGSRAPNLVATPAGELLLTWLQPQANDTFSLHLSRGTAADTSQTQTWQAPIEVTRGALLDNWADVPTPAALPDGTLLMTWLYMKSDGGYGIHWSRSSDDGVTWSSPAVLHEDTSGPEYGFVSTAVTPDDRLALYWLDSRAHEGGGAMQLRSAVVGSQGPVTERGLVDDRVCDCCQTSAASTSRGPIVAFRNREVGELRDIHVAGPHPRLGEAVHDDGWVIEGCPVNGPSVAASGQRLAIAWYTEAHENRAVKLAFGRVGGGFEPPIPLDLGVPLGRVALTMLSDGDTVVTFMERTGDGGGASIVARRVSDRGTVGAAYRVAETSAARGSGFPRAAVLGDAMVWAWTELSEDNKQVRVAHAKLDALR